MRTELLLIALLGPGCAASPPEPEHREPKWTLKFNSPIRPADSAKGMVYVRIDKVEPGLGKVSAKHMHIEGDRIGWWPEAPDGEPVSVHRVKLPNGNAEMVDFDTGLTLKVVIPVKKVIQVKRCRAIYKNGDKIACDVVLEDRFFECYEVTYGQGAETLRVFVPDPTRLNQLCPLHEWNPDAQVTEGRVNEARTLLIKAERLWATDSAAAIKIYQRLLQDYMDILLFLEVRNRVEGRTRQADK